MPEILHLRENTSQYLELIYICHDIFFSQTMQFTLSHVVRKPGEYLVEFDSPSFVFNVPQILPCEELEDRFELPSDGVWEKRVILNKCHNLLGPIYQTKCEMFTDIKTRPFSGPFCYKAAISGDYCSVQHIRI